MKNSNVLLLIVGISFLIMGLFVLYDGFSKIKKGESITYVETYSSDSGYYTQDIKKQAISQVLFSIPFFFGGILPIMSYFKLQNTVVLFAGLFLVSMTGNLFFLNSDRTVGLYLVLVTFFIGGSIMIVRSIKDFKDIVAEWKDKFIP